MKKFIAKASVAFLVVAGSVTFGATAASATEVVDICVPEGAWTEIVEHPAVGEPTITIDNPDYVPAQEEITKVVHHEAEWVHHEAITHTEYHFAKFTRERTKVWSWGGSDWSAWGNWVKYSPETHTSWELSAAPLGSPRFHSGGSRDRGTVKWEKQWQALFDGRTRVIEDKAAWDELVKEAWDETVVIQEATPAVGEPTITVDNADYVAAWTETIEHPAVECPVVVPDQPEVTVTSTSEEALDCDAATVTTTVTTTTSGRTVYNEETNAWTPIEDLVEVTSSERAATAEECPVVEPPAEETPAEEEPPASVEDPKPVVKAAAKVVAESDDTLAVTGGDVNPVLPIGGALLVLGGVALAALRKFAHN